MNAGLTSERVLDALRRALLEHRFRPGERLDPAPLATTLASSVTPVREALYVLAGEGLVETRTSDGFHVPQLDEPALRDRYQWNGQVARLAIGSREPRIASPADAEPDDLADRAAATMARIAQLSGNIELHRAMASLNARLHAARTIESEVLSDIPQELAQIHGALAADDRPALRKLVSAYCSRRERAAAVILRALYRMPTAS
ncbi:MAG: GntR family transcriptional regulator [Pseudomonadota bacterium]